jgi:hypothetical protein
MKVFGKTKRDRRPAENYRAKLNGVQADRVINRGTRYLTCPLLVPSGNSMGVRQIIQNKI